MNHTVENTNNFQSPSGLFMYVSVGLIYHNIPVAHQTEPYHIRTHRSFKSIFMVIMDNHLF